MTDDLQHLRDALKRVPAADPARRTEMLALAMENFDRAQNRPQAGAPGMRPMSDRPQWAGFLAGVRTMLSSLTTRPVLAGTTSLAALCVALFVAAPALRHQPAPVPAPVPAPTTSLTAAPTAAPVGEPTASDTKPVAPAQPDSGAAPQPEVKVKSLPQPAVPASTRDASTPEQQAARSTMMDAAPASVAEMAPPEPTAAAPQPAMEAAPLGKMKAWTDARALSPSTETFANAPQNPVHITAEEPVSTFSIDVDTASYSVVRSFLNGGVLPPPDAVRVEEMINYFPYDYPAPGANDAPFHASVSLFPTPWNKETELLRIGLQGQMPAIADRPPLNLVFLIDTSGSMDEPDKLPLLVQSFRMMLNELRPEDRIAIVTYAGSAGEVLAPTAVSDRRTISDALGRLAAGGSTAGAEGIALAYQVANGMKHDGSVTRVILATDGDFNVGLSGPEALKSFIAGERDSGTYLSVLGFGRGNLDDATMQALAQNGNGTATYIDTLSEARRVLVDQLTGALFPIADDVKIQIEFNPAEVAEYRLIGYETRSLAREDFNNDRVDAGEIGAGRQVTALYEVVRVGSPARMSDPLRYQAEAPAIKRDKPGELAYLRLRYKAPGKAASHLIETPVSTQTTAPDADARFAAAIAGFGQLLADSKYLGHWGWADAIALANGARGEDPFGYRADAVQLMRLAETLSKP